jgi:hypothetical protein
MRESLVFTNISDRAINEAFNIQMRQFLRFLKRRIDELVKWRSEFAEDEIQSELRDIASDGAKLHQMQILTARPAGKGLGDGTTPLDTSPPHRVPQFECPR